MQDRIKNRHLLKKCDIELKNSHSVAAMIML